MALTNSTGKSEKKKKKQTSSTIYSMCINMRFSRIHANRRIHIEKIKTATGRGWGSEVGCYDKWE